jgi:hypothetical protein
MIMVVYCCAVLLLPDVTMLCTIESAKLPTSELLNIPLSEQIQLLFVSLTSSATKVEPKTKPEHAFFS